MSLELFILWDMKNALVNLAYAYDLIFTYQRPDKTHASKRLIYILMPGDIKNCSTLRKQFFFSELTAAVFLCNEVERQHQKLSFLTFFNKHKTKNAFYGKISPIRIQHSYIQREIKSSMGLPPIALKSSNASKKKCKKKSNCEPVNEETVLLFFISDVPFSQFIYILLIFRTYFYFS